MMVKEKVLIVDDSKTARLIAQRVLSQTGKFFDVSHASNYEEAMVQFKPYAFDMMLIDINMPGKDGMELSQDILTLQPNANIVIVSSNAQNAVRQRALELGIQVVDKPFTADKLSLVLQNIYNMRTNYPEQEHFAYQA